MSTGFRVDPDILDVYASRVTALAERVRATARPEQPLGLGAYGVVGPVFAAAAAAAAEAGSTAADRAADRGAALAERLHAAGADYRQAERAAAAGLRGLR